MSVLVASAALALGAGDYEATFRALHVELARYPGLELKGIDWDAVGAELLPRAVGVDDDESFGRLCLELVARLEDSHAELLPGTAALPTLPWPRFDPGLACLEDDRGVPVVYVVEPDGPAARAGIAIGDTIVAVDGRPAADEITRRMAEISRWVGYSSERYLRYDAMRGFLRRVERDTPMALVVRTVDGEDRNVRVAASVGARYLPRLPVPIPGIRDSANVSWTMLPHENGDDIGYIYVRRIRDGLIEALDQAVNALADASGLVIDVRGNSGGGFDARRAHLNFARDRLQEEPERPRFFGPIAVLVDGRCISAGEGWTSWFVAEKRATLVGQATAGASSRKTVYTLTNGLYRVRFPVKLYRGALDRWIERRGLEPDVPVMPTAADLAAGRDTVLVAAKELLQEAPQNW